MNPLKLNTTSVSLAVTPTVVSTLLSHYINRSPLRQKPTAHLSYDEGLHLIRAFLQFASQHTVEELQAFTAQWVPHPNWVRVKEADITDEQLEKAASLLRAQLGKDGIARVGGETWWRWRKPETPLRAEWIEMKSDYQERKKTGEKGKRVMLYVHGGAYFFGSVDEHRYQMQRHARKLKARVFAPKYRLAPQFPFPCGLYDCLAAYLHLLTVQEPSEILLAGDSAGGGMVISMLCTMRDQGIPLPAGAILISPWVDLTHSFPSVSGDNPLDYIPMSGFHHKPSRAWPPPNEDDLVMMREQADKLKTGKKDAVKQSTLKDKRAEPFELNSASNGETNGTTNGNHSLAAGQNGNTDAASKSDDGESPSQTGEVQRTSVQLSVTIDGKLTTVKDQIQMYTTNELLPHPLVSPVTQPTLGGLPPLLIMAGGGEMLRDEQIYLAHKCANPVKYAPPDEKMSDADREKLKRYKPTYVQLQVWDDLCHVAPTLSFTRPAKYMYRSIAQFGAWALARAQNTHIDILDDDAISVISISGSDDEEQTRQDKESTTPPANPDSPFTPRVGKAGDTLPQFKGHMIRQRVTRHGAIYDLAPASELPACMMPREEVGVAKEIPVKRWLATKKQWEHRYSSTRAKVHQKIVKDMAAGYVGNGDSETPPPTALAGRRRAPAEKESKKKTKSIGLALWSLWGSKHDEMTVQREQQAEHHQETKDSIQEEGNVTRSIADAQSQLPGSPLPPPTPLSTASRPRSRSRVRTVVDEHQASQTSLTGGEEHTLVEDLIEIRKQAEKHHGHEASKTSKSSNFLSPDFIPETGVAGKRPHLEGIALPFSLGKEADSASMMTLQSTAESEVRPMSPLSARSRGDGPSASDSRASTPRAQDAATPFSFGGPSTYVTPAVELSRPQMDRDDFFTAVENLPLAAGAGQKTESSVDGVEVKPDLQKTVV